MLTEKGKKTLFGAALFIVVWCVAGPNIAIAGGALYLLWQKSQNKI